MAPHTIRVSRLPSPAVKPTRPSPSSVQRSAAWARWATAPASPATCGWRAGTMSTLCGANASHGPLPTRKAPDPLRT